VAEVRLAAVGMALDEENASAHASIVQGAWAGRVAAPQAHERLADGEWTDPNWRPR